jgi:hypothetical protein
MQPKEGMTSKKKERDRISYASRPPCAHPLRFLLYRRKEDDSGKLIRTYAGDFPYALRVHPAKR